MLRSESSCLAIVDAEKLNYQDCIIPPADTRVFISSFYVPLLMLCVSFVHSYKPPSLSSNHIDSLIIPEVQVTAAGHMCYQVFKSIILPLFASVSVSVFYRFHPLPRPLDDTHTRWTLRFHSFLCSSPCYGYMICDHLCCVDIGLVRNPMRFFRPSLSIPSYVCAPDITQEVKRFGPRHITLRPTRVIIRQVLIWDWGFVPMAPFW